MAGYIKGITIEIDGETKGLDAALKKVNTTVKSLQGELRRVDQLLKLHPGNTDLVRQKQKLLAQSITETRTKLDALRQAQKKLKDQGLDETNADYRRLQREITETSSKLKMLVAQQKKFEIESTKVGIAAAKMAAMGGKVSAVGQKLRGLTMATGLVGAAAVAVTAEFDSSMSKVQAISGATGEEFSRLRDKAREMGAKTKFSASEAAEAMNYMAMAGWKTKDMLSGIDGIMNLAAASGEDLATTSDIVTDGLTAMGYAAKDAGRLADVMAAASSNANTNVAMMGETFKYAAAVAGSMGYSMEDVALATGLMANAGIKASQAGTAIRSTISRMAAPTKQVAAAMDKIGISIENADGTAKPFREVMVDLRKKMKGLSETEKTQVASAIAGKNAMSGFLAIVNASDKDFNKLADAIDNSDGAALSMAETMQENLGGQVTILKSQLQELAIAVGDTLVPMARKAVAAAQKLTDWFNSLSAGSKDLVVKIALITAAAGPLLIVVGGLTKAFQMSISAIGSAAGAITAAKTAEEGATVATKALALAQKAVPWVAAAAGAALVAKAMIDTYRSTHEATLKVKDHAKARQESVDKIQAEAKESEFYLGKLEELSGVENKTVSQKKLMKAYVDRLNESIDGLNLKYDEEKDKLNQTTDAIQKKIDKMREEAMAAAYQKNAKAAWEEYANAQMKAAEVKDELALKQEKWNALSDAEKQTNGQLQQQIQDLKKKVSDYNGAMDKALKDANKWTNASQMNSDAWKGIKEEAKKAGIEIPKSVTHGMKSGMYQVPQSVKELQALIKFDDMKERATGDAKETAQKLAQGLTDGTVSAKDAAKKLEKAMSAELSKSKGTAGKAGSQTGKSYAASMKGKSGDAKGAGKALHASGQKGATGNLNKQGKSAGSSYSSALKNTKGQARSAASALNDAAKRAADKKSLLYHIGSSIGSGLASGLRSALGSVRSAASALIDAANKAAKAKAKVNSPSKLFRDGVGKAIPEGLADGIRKGIPEVKKASGSMIDLAEKASVLNAPKKSMALETETAISSLRKSSAAQTVYNIGDVTLDVSKLEDVATLEDIVTVFRRAKQFA